MDNFAFQSTRKAVKWKILRSRQKERVLFLQQKVHFDACAPSTGELLTGFVPKNTNG